MTPPPARSAEQRKKDVLARLENDKDVWVATASAEGLPTMVPLSFVWDDGTLLLCTRRTNPTAVNAADGCPAVVTLGHTRDVVHIEGTARTVPGPELSAASADAFAAKLVWDPRDQKAWTYLRISPRAIRAWREVNELATRELMRDGVWLV
ncbi:pyridoxamine 5'-phosphate oxidase family protein [Streptomyces mesophilus]|uniref:pyridoxamine 5'-phosphate oxidase family protein n=1 Tax=Streptomyces mesophilus TaxID=1775132 RepID=UPI00331BC8A1